MAPLCLFYFFVVGCWLAAAGMFAERALPRSAPRRGIWCATLFASVVLPMFLSASHSSHVMALWGTEFVRVPATHHMVDANSPTSLRAWLDCSAGFGGALLRV